MHFAHINHHHHQKDNIKSQIFCCCDPLPFMTHRFKNRLAQLFAFSLLTNFLSLKILPTFRQILTKTLDFLRMDSLFFSADGGDDDSMFGSSSTVRSIQSLSDLDDERLYLVDHMWVWLWPNWCLIWQWSCFLSSILSWDKRWFLNRYMWIGSLDFQVVEWDAGVIV